MSKGMGLSTKMLAINPGYGKLMLIKYQYVAKLLPKGNTQNKGVTL